MKRNRALILSFILVSTVVAALSGCKQGAPAVTVKSPEAELSPMIVGSASVFMEIVNAGSGDDTLPEREETRSVPFELLGEDIGPPDEHS